MYHYIELLHHGLISQLLLGGWVCSRAIPEGDTSKKKKTTTTVKQIKYNKWATYSINTNKKEAVLITKILLNKILIFKYLCLTITTKTCYVISCNSFICIQ